MANQDETYGGAYSGAQIDQAIGAYLSGSVGGGTNNNYSTEEQVIGTWIDGKPLYRKCYTFTVPTSSTNKWVSISNDLTDIFPQKMYGRIYRPTTDDIAPLGVPFGGVSSSLCYSMSGIEKPQGFKYYINHASLSGEAIAVLEYTKTTD